MQNRLGARGLTSGAERGFGYVIVERPAAHHIVRVKGRLRVVVQGGALEGAASRDKIEIFFENALTGNRRLAGRPHQKGLFRFFRRTLTENCPRQRSRQQRHNEKPLAYFAHVSESI